jgi:hypothetical protein
MLLKIAKKIAEDLSGNKFDHIKSVMGGRNSRIFRLDSNTGSSALKFYREDNNSVRDRFDAETSALTLFNERGINCVPKIIAQDRENNCILMKWIDGEPVPNFNQDDINELLDFLKAVHEISKSFNSNEIRFATDACLNGNEIVAQISRRLERLQPSKNIFPDLSEFIDNDFIPAFKEISHFSKEAYLKNGITIDQNISQEKLTLSPVDIGFHNCLRTENRLFFIDYEFFGWDDPVKLVADTLQHPGSILSWGDNTLLQNKLESLYMIDENFMFRLNCLYPLFGLKWCMIMLNQFLPNYNVINLKDGKKEQLIKVKSKLKTILQNYNNNTYG